MCREQNGKERLLYFFSFVGELGRSGKIRIYLKNEELKRKQSLLQKKLKEAVYQERPKIKKHSIRYMGDDDD